MSLIREYPLFFPAAKEIYEGVYKTGIDEFIRKTLETISMGDGLIMERGTFHMHKQGTQVEYGKYAIITVTSFLLQL